MRRLPGLLGIVCLLCAWGAVAADNVLLIQLQPDGSFRVWHNEGETNITDEEAIELDALARPEGSDPVPSTAGPANVFLTDKDEVIIRFPEAKRDAALLVDRDNCGHVRLWHADGETQLGEEALLDIVLSALPGGGRRLEIGGLYAKGYQTRYGVTAVLWPRRPR